MEFVPKFHTIADLFEQSVAKFASRPLFGSKSNGQWNWLTFSEFKQRVDAFRGGLAAAGVSRGDKVAIISGNRLEWAIASFACVGLGVIYVPMYEAQLGKDWEFILNDSESKLLIVSTSEIYERTRDFPGKLPSLRRVVCMDAACAEQHSFARMLEIGESNPAAAGCPTPSDVAFLIYTSGTTGEPKGVILSHENVASNVSAIHQLFDLTQEDRSLSFLPWAHSLGLTAELHTMLSMGASIGINSAVDKLIEELSEVKPTILVSVPRIFNRIYDGVQNQMSQKPAPIRKLFHGGMAASAKQRDGKALSVGERITLSIADAVVFSKIRRKFGGRLRYAISGGAALAREVGEFIDNLGIKVYEGYGLTETSPVTNVNYPGHRRMGSVGPALPGVRVVIDRAATQDPLQGEIVIYGPNVMKGYHKRPQETAAVLMGDGGFRTGDMGYLDDDGYLFITGRIKEQYKLENGKYVVPSPLEEALKLSPFITNAYVHGANKPFNVALVVPDASVLMRWTKAQGIEAAELEELVKDTRVLDKLRAELDSASKGFKGFERVEKFAVILEDFTTVNGMLTPSLKLKRRAVLERWGDRIESLYA